MRDAFAAEITAVAAEDERVMLLAGDIGNRLFDPYRDRFPDRYINCGIAEANLTTVAAGMAACGLRPFTYSITPFITTRCLEQIRVDICYHELPVIIVGTGSGLAYNSLGATHHSCEDIGFLRLLPSMTVVCPGDPVEVRLAVRAALAQPGPVYIRLGKKGEPTVHATPPSFEIGKGIVLAEGNDLCLLSTGNMLPVALDTAKLLTRHGIGARVVSLHTVKPLDEALLTDTFARFPLVATLEEHSRIGGLGGAVAEWLSDQNPGQARLERFGTLDLFAHEAGDQDFARERFGLTAEAISRRLLTLAEERAS